MIELDGLRIVELGGGVSAAWATKWLADLGADVIKVEPPGGDPLRLRGPFRTDGEVPDLEGAGFFHYLNANKRGIVLDLDLEPDRRELDRVIASAEAVIHNLPVRRFEALGLGREELRARNPRLTLCSISPFGLTGPRRYWRAEDLTTLSAGGWTYLSPGASKEVDRPPLKPAGHQADFAAGTIAAVTTLAALYRAQQSGEGEHIDLSGQAVVAAMLEAALPFYTYRGDVVDRCGTKGLNPWGIYACQDGLIFLMVAEEDQWQRLVDFMGRPDWAELEIFEKMSDRFLNADVLDIFVEEWIAGWNVQELFHEGQARRICFAPVLEMSELAESEHLKAREFLAEQEIAGQPVTVPGPPYRLSGGGWALRRPAPRLNQHGAEVLRECADRLSHTSLGQEESAPTRTKRAPLEGLRVIDLSWVWAGPYCTLQLAHLGADVIKVESESRPDLGRRLPIFVPDTPPGLNRSGYFNQWGQGKRSLALDLSQKEAVEILKELIADCDVVTENYASGVMDRLGLGWPVLSEINPRLIMASISGYGHTGPWAHYSAYGPATPPISGLSSLTGYRDGLPREVGIALGDPASGLTAAVGICAALISRERTDTGQHIDVSLWEATTVLTAEGWLAEQLTGSVPPRMGNRDLFMAPHGCFRSSDEGGWVSIACTGDEEWQALSSVFAPELASDPRFATAPDRKANEDELDSQLAAWVGQRDRWDITERLQAVGVAAFPSATTKDLVNDPQLRERGFFSELEHPEVGRRVHAGIPWHLSQGPNGVRAPAPLLGADTDDVLRELLGASAEQISAWRDAGLLR